jgi:hypothetical protein
MPFNICGRARYVAAHGNRRVRKSRTCAKLNLETREGVVKRWNATHPEQTLLGVN